MSHHVNQELFDQNPNLTDLSWQPANKYKYTFLEKCLRISYDITRPFIAMYCRLTGANTVAALTNLSINLLSYARGYNKNNSTLLWKQAVLETGAFNSIMSNTDNNQFGMHLPYYRPTTTSSYRYNDTENSHVSIYDSVFDSVLDRMLWDDYNGIDPKASNYIEEVVEHDYNENPDTYPDLWQNAIYQQSYLMIFIWLCVVILILIFIKKLIF